MGMNIRAMYFSGTGTTAKVTSHVAYRLWQLLENEEHDNSIKAEDIDFTPKAMREKIYKFTSEDFVIFGVPVIAGRVPNVLLKFLDTLEGGGAKAVPVVLYGNRSFDDALIELRNILLNRGFYTVAAGAFIGEHSFSKVLAAGRPDTRDMEIADDFAKKIAEKIINIRQADKEIKDMAPIEVEGHNPIRPYYKPLDANGEHINILKVKPVLDEEKCTGCGTCVRICPMGSIEADAPGKVIGICMKCSGCIKKCPEGALRYEDEGLLYHKEDLEHRFAQRKEPSIFI